MSQILIGDKACEKCAFGRVESAENRLVCRRFPPQVVTMSTGKPGEHRLQSLWPLVQPTNWCGEYKLDIKLHQ